LLAPCFQVGWPPFLPLPSPFPLPFPLPLLSPLAASLPLADAPWAKVSRGRWGERERARGAGGGRAALAAALPAARLIGMVKYFVMVGRCARAAARASFNVLLLLLTSYIARLRSWYSKSMKIFYVGLKLTAPASL